MKQSKPKMMPSVYRPRGGMLASLAGLFDNGFLSNKYSGTKYHGTTPNKLQKPHQGKQEKARNACGRVIQYVKPVWADANHCYTGKGKRTEHRRP